MLPPKLTSLFIQLHHTRGRTEDQEHVYQELSWVAHALDGPKVQDFAAGTQPTVATVDALIMQMNVDTPGGRAHPIAVDPRPKQCPNGPSCGLLRP